MTVELAFKSAGSGPPVLILHGLFGSGRNWHAIAGTMASTHEVLAVDLRNHGDSPWTGSMNYIDMARDVQALITREQLQQPHVIGHSMGGKTAMALALLYPECVGRLTVVDIVPASYGDRLSPYMSAMRHMALIPQKLGMPNEHFDWRCNLQAIGASLPELCGFPRALLERRFERPVSLIAGSQSDYVTPEDESRFKAMFPCLDLTFIEGAGHWVHADRPEEFLAAVRRGHLTQVRRPKRASAPTPTQAFMPRTLRG
jgi:pimeloyl-ACP methyl ester carboxylesterase